MNSAPRSNRLGLHGSPSRGLAVICSLGLFLVAASCEAADTPSASKPTAAAEGDSTAAGATSAPGDTPAPGDPAAAKKKLQGVEAIDAFIATQDIVKGDDVKWKSSLTAPPQVEFDSSKTYFWLLETNVGMIKIELLPAIAPMHVSSTIYLTRLGFYDNIRFHRVIRGFMAQGGDPTGTGRGGPGYRYSGEFSDEALHDRPGVLSMANAGPGTDASQFFLTFKQTPHLNGKHTVFGYVVEGMGTVRELEDNGSARGKPQTEMFIERATIVVETIVVE
jgi:peptidyl-prolyl cis-trans isomerase B (cyclophilin B)